MDNQTLFVGLGTIAAIVGLLIVAFLQHRTVAALVDVVSGVNSNDAVIAAIKGATEGIPQSAFNQVLSVLAAGRTFAPTPDLQDLIDQLTVLLDKVDNDSTNDPAATIKLIKAVVANAQSVG